ncbi:MAG: tryptophan--tRNA ligase [Deltaproteobacteria bacterium]|nr:tryptophan--tRNA ligase [Deltaproteobacteria bacterium]
MRILSGIQPSGTLHLGNYFGAIQQHIELQAEAGGRDRAFYFIANLHTLTSLRDADKLRALTRDVALDYLALGLEPERATFFRQSDVPEVTELAWYLSCVTGKGLLERAVSYKDKIAKGLEPTMGLFNYPVLMAADILIYRSTMVPVGKDQQQHVEMAQDMATHFNVAFGKEVLTRPDWRFSKAPIVPGLDGAKMSKSYGNTIPIFLPEGMTEKQAWKTYFASIVTDSKGVDDPKDPNDTLMLLYRLLDPSGAAELEPAYVKGGIGYGDVKKRIHAAYSAKFAQFRDKRAALAKDDAYVEGVLEEGGKRARAVAHELMREVRETVGIAAGAWAR